MWISRDHFNELKKAKNDLYDARDDAHRQRYTVKSITVERDHYLELWKHARTQIPPTLEQQLEEARRINKELTDKRTLEYLLNSNKKLQEENK